MAMKRVLACTLVIALLWTSAGVGTLAQGNTTLPGMLQEVEHILYGREHDDALIARVDRLEMDVYGEHQSGALFTRIQRLHSFLTTGEFGGGSLKLKLNAAEYLIFQRLTEGTAIVRRVDEVEAGVFGSKQEGSIAERVRGLLDLVWGPSELNVRAVELPKETLVRIALLSEVNSAQNQVGNRINYRVVDDVMIDGRVVIPAGAEGQGRVAEVESAGRLGRAGRVQVNFGTVPALDGTRVQLEISERASSQNQEMAAAASVAGVILLGPIGLAGGFLVRGEEHILPTGTQFYVQVDRDVRVQGLSLTPVSN